MAFEFDRQKWCARDPDTGWELHKEGAGREYVEFVLLHPRERPIAIWAGRVPQEQLEDRTPVGSKGVHIRYEIDSVHGPPAGPPAAEQQLIADAIIAYESRDNDPHLSVEVVFNY